eukprot:TRINITY_DN18608_c0_g2_i1.p1 TRINITY_DN18608_c0_g2~~TRINITY_DN18608_c0_g2_i1.p1  ORF type:complete len:120 (+),score=20.28 TRINITY_DN18608_c0_g2_i1:281-640(+)
MFLWNFAILGGAEPNLFEMLQAQIVIRADGVCSLDKRAVPLLTDLAESMLLTVWASSFAGVLTKKAASSFSTWLCSVGQSLALAQSPMLIVPMVDMGSPSACGENSFSSADLAICYQAC